MYLVRKKTRIGWLIGELALFFFGERSAMNTKELVASPSPTN
jgi:hypothetical protein